MDEYLRTTNAKPLFRDVIIEADYDPLRVREHNIRIPTGGQPGRGAGAGMEEGGALVECRSRSHASAGSLGAGRGP